MKRMFKEDNATAKAIGGCADGSATTSRKLTEVPNSFDDPEILLDKFKILDVTPWKHMNSVQLEETRRSVKVITRPGINIGIKCVNIVCDIMHTSRNPVASHYEFPLSAFILQLDFNLVEHPSSLPIMLIFKRPTPPENVYWFDKNFSNVSKTNVRNFDPSGGKFDVVQAAILNVVKVLYEINILEQHFLVATVQTTKSESVMSVNRKKSWMHQLNLESTAADNDIGKKSGLLPDGNKIGILPSVFSDIVFANLATLCSDKFPCRNLAAAFWNCLNCIEADVEVGYPGLMDAVVLLGISCAFEHAIRCDSAYTTIVIDDVQKGKLVLFVNSMSLSGNLVGFSKVDMKASLEFLNVQDLFMDGTLFSLTQGLEMAAVKSHVHPWANFVAFCLLGESVVACSFSIHGQTL